MTWSLKAPANGQVNCLPKPSGKGFRCLASCVDGYQFTDGEPAKTFECENKRIWVPSSIVPDCVPVDTDEASYDVEASVTYRAGGSVPENCLDRYTSYFSSFYSDLNEVLTERCSAVNVKMDVDFHNTKIRFESENEIKVNYTLRVNPAVQQPLLYDLCGYTLGLIFDLSVPNTNIIIQPIMNISGQSLGGDCPSVRAIKSVVTRGFTCEVGQVLNEKADGVPKCRKCHISSLRNSQVLLAWSNEFHVVLNSALSRRNARLVGRRSLHPVFEGILSGPDETRRVQELPRRNLYQGNQ